MPDRTQKFINVSVAIVGLLSGLAGLFGAFVLLPSRMDAAERQLVTLKDREEVSREMLIRIEERLVSVDKTVQELKGRK